MGNSFIGPFEIFRNKLEQSLLKEEIQDFTRLRELGFKRNTTSTSYPGLDIVAKRTISSIVADRKMKISSVVRLYQNRTKQGAWANPAKCEGYLRLDTLVNITYGDVTNRAVYNPQKPCIVQSSPKCSFSTKHYWSCEQRFTAVSLGLWRKVTLIRQWRSALSFPVGVSTNDCLAESCLPEVDYADAMTLTTRVKYLATIYPVQQVCILKGYVKGVYRHLITHAHHVYHMAGCNQKLHGIVIDMAAPFGWSGSPTFYGVKFSGRAISCRLKCTITGLLLIYNTPCFGYRWVDDHVMIEANIDGRLLLSESTIHHAMVAILGPRAVKEA
ncbi:LOW QUALITY PROTEIN: hypothetical protein PHMEG_0008458 [Phytophthora megakarya]|uniref:Reverse transcriptase n=1 Tax=Phytophthora megakarya TaxID=4795 RepID=A0A225WIN9_9STRA|nr:LOW QUALITY PROTEIN: hypothetical protein PHMEG_0008458 [Phytophthora megakarya]